MCSISEDHLSWLPENDRTIERIIYEKTSSLLNSYIIVAKQSSDKIVDCIKMNIANNSANKVFYNEDYSYVSNGKNFIYRDKFGTLKVPRPSMKGEFQLENASTAIAALRVLKELKIKDTHITQGVKNAYNMARLEEIKSGRLKDMIPNNTLIVDSSHNPAGAKALNEYIKSLNCDVHAVVGMMPEKSHEDFINHIKNIKSLTVIDIPNTSSISGKELKEKFKNIKGIQYKESIEQAVKSAPLKKDDYLIITGSIYLAGEVLKIN